MIIYSCKKDKSLERYIEEWTAMVFAFHSKTPKGKHKRFGEWTYPIKPRN